MYRLAVRRLPAQARPVSATFGTGQSRVFLGAFRPLSCSSILRFNEPFPVRRGPEKEDLSHLPKYQQWAIYFNSREFKKSMTYYYVCAFGALCVAFYFYMRDRYYEDMQLRVIRVKYDKDPSSLLEYEYLKLKALSSDKLKPREERKYRIYQMMRKEYRRQHLLDADAVFNPSPEELDEWFGKQARQSKRSAAAVAATAEEPEKTSNSTNASVVQAEDTTAFFEEKAAQYDDEIKWEERGIMMGKRRRWLMSQLQGDVLEVACGTGRNIPYLDTERVNSVTFLDSSANMVKLAQKKFRERFPKYARVAFTVGKAEDLVDLATEDLKYDTIVEAFGLCAHEDPVAALKNMRQLLRPGGRIVLLEHGRGNWDFVNNHLDFRANKRMKTWACRWNLDIGELVDDAGLDITYEKRVHLGTTWMLVCKRPEDEYKDDEKPFYNRLFGREVNRIKKE